MSNLQFGYFLGVEALSAQANMLLQFEVENEVSVEKNTRIIVFA